MSSPSDLLEAAAVADNNRAGEFDALPLSEWEQGEKLDRLSTHDAEYRVTAEVEGASLEAIGVYSGGELVQVHDIEVIWRSET